MKQRLVPVLGSMAVLATVLTAGSAPAGAQPRVPARQALAVPDLATAQAALNNTRAKGAPGAFARVQEAGGYDRKMASGYGALNPQTPIEPAARFRTASVTKVFTAALVLRQVSAGKVNLDAPIRSYLPAGTLPANWKMTVRQVLQHRSGIRDYAGTLLAGDTVTAFQRLRYKVYGPRDLVAMATRKGLAAAPGKRFLYSNTNFVLLGMVVEKVTGRGYADVLRGEIIDRLGLTETSYVMPERTIAGEHPRGYLTEDRRSRPLFDATEQTASWINTAGALITSANDLNRFMSALVRGEVVPARELAQMRQTLPVNSSGTVRYGLGLREYRLSCGQRVYGHGGILQGYQTFAVTSADGQRQLTAVANASNNMTVNTALFGVIEPAFCGSRTGTEAPSIQPEDIAREAVEEDVSLRVRHRRD